MNRFSTEWLFATGVCLMAIALALLAFTLADREFYGVVLLLALGATIAADWCLLLVAWRGGGVWRLLATIVIFPTIFVLLDLLRRAPYAF